MPLTSVSLLAQSNSLKRNTNSIQMQMNEKGYEVSTGKKYDIVASVRGEVRNYVDLKAVHTTLEKRFDRMTTAGNRMSTIQNALGGAREQMRILMDNIEGRSDLADDLTISVTKDQARSAINAFAMNMNVTWGGRTLFGGDGVDRPPLENMDNLRQTIATIIDTHATANGGSITTESQMQDIMDEINQVFDETHPTPGMNFSELVYSGGDGDLPGVEMIENEVMKFGVKANDPSIKEALKGAAILAAIDSFQAVTDSKKLVTSYIEEGVKATRDGHDAIVETQSVVGHKEERVSEAQESITASIHYFATRVGSYENADPAEAATVLKGLEQQLELSFYVTAQLTRQSLLDYVR